MSNINNIQQMNEQLSVTNKPKHWPTRNTRNSKSLMPIIEFLQQSQWWPEAQIQQRQKMQLAEILNYAKANTEYYAEVLKDYDCFSEQSITEELLSSLPYTYKKDIQHHESRFIVKHPEPQYGRTFVHQTSGSTGVPLSITWNEYASSFIQAKVFRYYQWHESDPQKKMSRLQCLPILDDGTSIPKIGRNWYPLIPGGNFATHAASMPISFQVQWLQEQNPHYLFTFPSNAAALLRYAKKHKITLPNLERIDTFAETMIDELPELAEAVFNCKVADKYSSREIGEIATRCPVSGLYHIQAETIFVEVRKDNGELAKEGEIGQLIITNLTNTAMPIIRYAIEDYAEVGPKCSCGRGLPTLSRIMGRQRNMLILENGDQLWPRFGAEYLHEVAPVSQVQLIQKAINDVVVKVVPVRELTKADEQMLFNKIWEKFPKNIKLTLECVDAIARTKGGKFEDFRCEISLSN